MGSQGTQSGAQGSLGCASWIPMGLRDPNRWNSMESMEPMEIEKGKSGKKANLRREVHFAPPSANGKAVDPTLPAGQESWQQWVKDALSHYWGGPKLTESPLTNMELVQRTRISQDVNLTRALRAVLQEAIERQRPDGERKLTASEWLLYNILDLRFVQGQRVRDIARRLAMSESDLYRKQRAAVAEVAKTLAEMEAAVNLGEVTESNGSSNS